MLKHLSLKLTTIFVLAIFILPMVLMMVPSVVPTASAAGLIIPTTGYTAECAVEPYTTTTGLSSSYFPVKAIDGTVSDASRWAYTSAGSAIPAGTTTTTRYATFDFGSSKTFNTVSFWMDRQIASTGANFTSLSLQYSDTLDTTLTSQTPTTMTFSTSSTNDITDASQTIKKYTTSRLSNITARYVRFAFTYTKNCALNTASTSLPCPVEINLSYDFDTLIPTTAYTAPCAVEPYTTTTNLSGTSYYPEKAIDGNTNYASRWAYSGTVIANGQTTTRYATYDLGTSKTFNELTIYRINQATTDFTLNNCTIQVSDAIDSTLTSETGQTTVNFTLNEADKYNSGGTWVYKYTTPKFTDVAGRYVRLGFKYTSGSSTSSKSPAMPTEIFLGTDIDVQNPFNAVTADMIRNANRDLNNVTTNLALLTTGLNGTTISWTSDNEAVISPTGVVTRPEGDNSNASVTLTATISKAGFPDTTKTFNVTVLVKPSPVAGISLNKETTSITVGNTEKLIAIITPSYAANKNILWLSSNSSVATVDDFGVVTAVAPGSADILVTTYDGGYTDACTVTVTEFGTIKYNVTGTVSALTGADLTKVSVVAKQLDVTVETALVLADGTFSISLEPGVYTITVSRPGYLAKNFTDFTVTTDASQILSATTISLVAGDVVVTDQNTIDLQDLQRILSNFGLTSSDLSFNAMYDLNDDGAVNLIDLQAVLKNFGAVQ